MSLRHSTEHWCALALAAVLAGCSSAPPAKPDKAEPAAAPVAATAAPSSTTAAKTTATAAGSPAATPGAPKAAPVDLPRRAVADFDRAVGMMRSGNTTEAELEFKQIAVTYPQLSAPHVNLGILFRKGGHLDESEDALQTAVQRNGASAVAWTELGATQRLRGKFQDAADSYQKAIAADPNYAPAYRNLGVVSDLFLADPERALSAFERYKELTGEDKPVSSWIAELRQRTGKPAVRPPAPAAAPSAAPVEAPHEAPSEPATAPTQAPAPTSTPAPAPSARGTGV